MLIAGLVIFIMFGPLLWMFQIPRLPLDREMLANWAGFLIFLGGAWLLATPEPGSDRTGLRALVGLLGVQWLSVRIAVAVRLAQGAIYADGLVGDLLTAVLYVAIFRTVARQAARTRDIDQFRRANWIAYGLGFCLLANAGLEMLRQLTRIMPVNIALFRWEVRLWVCELLFEIWAVAFLERFAAVLREEYLAGKSIWATYKPPLHDV